jgi:medium-chain acyl-[acyl-carrier-protein] hydrolase
MDEPLLFEKKYLIHSYEADFNGNATLSALCNFLQETAWSHAQLLGAGYDKLLTDNKIWVLSRLQVEMETYPRWTEEITVQTWPKGIKGVYAQRDFLLYDSHQKIIGKANSDWLILDATNHKLIRIGPNNLNIPCIPNKHALDNHMGKITVPEEFEKEESRNARYCEIDVNQHVNNVRYLEWLLDTYEVEIYKLQKIAALQVNFLSEVKAEENVVVKSTRTEDKDTFLHQIICKSPEKDILRAKIRWTEK